ncbi:hypothetical protein [Methanolobus vulcani]|uniref:V-type ATPase 116kDa subunit family protein n=1 Tax=Methanolobus vulcani TaxID=38026 RepID=A0A7Z8KRA9_9EURY|nr:hypothetical protein [Methanolobus vulcani]TQD27567.1 V-type ATPase 116kDa subunit family protein [Methanolobus vulcani]
MNNDMADQGAENNAPHTYDRKELIEAVVMKHKKYIDEYTTEFNELGSKMKELQENIDSSNKNRTEVMEKIEILAEKRQLFYHQAEKLLDELAESISTEDFSREKSHVMDKLAKVKGSLSPEEEQKHVESILQDISALGSKATGINDRLSTIRDRIKDALGYKIEMSSIDSSEEKFNSNMSSYEEGIKEIEPRYKWLENRINSHKEAQGYWEKQPLTSDKQEVEA